MKKFFALFLIMSVVMTSFASVATAAKESIRIARLPIIIQNNVLDYETSVTLEMKLARAISISVNKKELPPKDSAALLNEIWQEIYDPNNQPKLSDAIKILADDLDADWVICPIINQYFQRETPSEISPETHLLSMVSTRIIIYNKSTGNFIDKNESRRFDDVYHRFGTASHLAGECFDQLINDTDLKQILNSKIG